MIVYGNVLGWVISAVIASAVGFFIYQSGMPAHITPPTGKLPEGLKSASFATDPRTVVPAGTDDCDAGDAYRQAAMHLKENGRLMDAFLHAASGPEKLRAARAMDDDVERLVDATKCARMTLFAKNPSEVVNYDNVKPLLPELANFGNVVINIGALYTKTDPLRARRDMEAVFTLGRHLYEERIIFEEYRVGLDLMINASGMLAQFGTDAGDTARLAQLKAFEAEGAKQSKAITPLWAAISGIGTGPDGRLAYSGDMFQIATSSPETMWRTEAMLKLGRMRYMSVASYGDQTGAHRLLKLYSDRSDIPAPVKAAARVGRDLTIEKFRMFGGGT
jgi:hypothetical protein